MDHEHCHSTCRDESRRAANFTRTPFGHPRVGLFGSFVREDQHQKSDVDLLVTFREDEATFDHFMDLCFLLEDAFGRKVEIVTSKYLSPYIGLHILREVEDVGLDD